MGCPQCGASMYPNGNMWQCPGCGYLIPLNRLFDLLALLGV